MAVIMSLVPTNTAALMSRGVPVSTAASPAVITSAAALRRQIGATDAPIVTSICGYAVAEDARLKSISPPEDMVCAMDPPNRLFGFCPKKFSLKDAPDIINNCEWNAWCIDAYDCSDGCGIDQARGQFGTTRCHAASRPFCQLTRLANTHTDEADPYWSVGCGSGHYSIHHYLLDQKAALDTSVLATTTAAATTSSTSTTSSSKQNPFSFTTEDDNFTAPRVQAPVAMSSTSKPVIPTSSSPPPTTIAINPTPSANTLPSSSIPEPSTTSTSATHPRPELQTSDLPTYISSANTPSEEEENQKKHNPKSAILGSVIGALAVIYLLLFTWWYRGPRRRKRAREAKEAAEAALRERGFWRPGAHGFEANGVNGANGFHGPQGPQEIHELGFGTMTNPKTPKLPEMPNIPQTPKTFNTLQTKATENGIGNGNGKEGELPGLSSLSPMAFSRWGGGSVSATSAGSPRSGVTSSKFRSALESGIFGIEKPAKVVVTTTNKEVAELDGRYMTFEERDRERRERLEGIDLATRPVRWEGSGNGGGNGTFGGGGSNNTPVTRTTMVPPTEWYLGQKAEDERGTIHVGWSPFDRKWGGRVLGSLY